jgi:hypothetical protein
MPTMPGVTRNLVLLAALATLTTGALVQDAVVGSVAQWCGKVNMWKAAACPTHQSAAQCGLTAGQHVNGWRTDADGKTGCWTSTKTTPLDYCQKKYPNKGVVHAVLGGQFEMNKWCTAFTPPASDAKCSNAAVKDYYDCLSCVPDTQNPKKCASSPTTTGAPCSKDGSMYCKPPTSWDSSVCKCTSECEEEENKCLEAYTNGDWHDVQFNDFSNDAGGIKPLMAGACRVLKGQGQYCCKSTGGSSGNPHGVTKCYGGSLNFWGREFKQQANPLQTCRFCSGTSGGDCFTTTSSATGQCIPTYTDGQWHAVQFNDFSNNAGDIKPLMTGACRVHQGKYCCKSTAGNSGNTHGTEFCYSGSLNFWGRVFKLQAPRECEFCSKINGGDCFSFDLPATTTPVTCPPGMWVPPGGKKCVPQNVAGRPFMQDGVAHMPTLASNNWLNDL